MSSATLEYSVFLLTDKELGVNASLLRVDRRRDKVAVFVFIVEIGDDWR